MAINDAGAIISECGRYRYVLNRPSEVDFPGRGAALWIMLNPSTADAQTDDPTIRKCRGFARTWGCRGIMVANLYALRSTDPAGLWAVDDPIGPENDRHLQAIAGVFPEVIFAFGNNAPVARVAEVERIFRGQGAKIWCLGTTLSGAPRHPGRIGYQTPLEEWPGVLR
ncbi:MAG: DUF1643 domain-containing protein [Anaerolineae bacterium]|nr:DUF1643 domain-containing protein [Anaerolineae bacterium]